MDTNDEMRCITPETYMTAKSFFAERQKLTGRPADKSIESLPKSDTLFKNEAFSHMAGLNNEKPETAEQEKTTATAPSLMTLLKNRSR